MKLLVLSFTCGRDESLLPSHLRMLRATYPGATIVLAEDAADPLPDPPHGIARVPHTWSVMPARDAVPEAIARAVTGRRGHTHFLKTDCDTAHLRACWLRPFQTSGVRGVGFQLPRLPLAWYGPAYSTDIQMAWTLATACRRIAAWTEEEDVTTSILARREAPNGIHLHPHAPRQGGPFSDWNPTGCRDATLYASRFHVVHCRGVGMDTAATREVMHTIELAAVSL